jgi:TolB-like protein/Flp pilus assembly protein TadD
MDYLSDGMTESLINSMSQLPQLSVKARSTVFRYKNQPANAQRIASELSVQAIVEGRLVQHGDDLTLYLALVDGRNGDQIWGEQYHRKLKDLIALQSEIARDVSHKLRARLSGAEERKVAGNYTDNTEAYQLYLKGRYQVLKQKRSETQKGISYFQQAIAIDPSYALAYVGLAEANRALSLSGEMPSAEYMPKAKAAAQKAIEIDDTLAEGHSALGFIVFWHDWDWNEAENQCKRALELDPNSADSHLVYAHLLSNTGRHSEALAEAKRARELDPLNLRTNALEGEFLIHAGRTDEALDRLQKTFELDPNYWFAHVFASSAYIEKGMFAEAVAEAKKARDLSEGNAQPFGFLGYALAKLGKQAEARVVLQELLNRSAERSVPAYYIALIYSALDQRNEAVAWLERGYEQREPRMAFLKVEPKWNSLRDDPRFQSLVRRVGFPS